MIGILNRLSSSLIAAVESEDQLWGRAAFIAVFVLLLAGLVLIPGRLIGQSEGSPPWWRNVRIWAIAITLAQILIYFLLG